MRSLLSLLAVVVPVCLAAQATTVGRDATAPATAASRRAEVDPLPGVVVRHLSSRLVDHDYELFVAVPEGYDTSTVRYPALYVLDACSQFAMVTQAYRMLRWAKQPPLVLVGISYPGGEEDCIRHRARDFTPTALPIDSVGRLYGPFVARLTPRSGGADAFLRSLREELIPFVEREYRVDPGDRGILGHSYGGLFTAYATFAAPGLFRRVLVASPALWWDGYAVFRTEEEYHAARTDLPLRMLATVGTEEGSSIQESWERLRATLGGTRYTGLEFAAVKLEGENHFSVLGATYSRALRVLYAKSPPPTAAGARTP